MVKLKEEYDYKSLSRKLEKEIDRLVIENERQMKAMLGAEGLEKAYEEVINVTINFWLGNSILMILGTSANCRSIFVFRMFGIDPMFNCNIF